MRIVSWNVNGLRSCYNKGFYSCIESLDADMICLQETKLSFRSRIASHLHLPGYSCSFTDSRIGGQSGTAIYERNTEVIDTLVFGSENDRIIGFEYDNFIILSTYFPNCGKDNCKLQRRLNWDVIFRDIIENLQKSKPVIICGDLNVCCSEKGSSQESFEELLNLGFVDAYTLKHKYSEGISYRSYYNRSVDNPNGMRLDYFLVDKRLQDKIIDSFVKNDIEASDHYPIVLDIDL